MTDAKYLGKQYGLRCKCEYRYPLGNVTQEQIDGASYGVLPLEATRCKVCGEEIPRVLVIFGDGGARTDVPLFLPIK